MYQTKSAENQVGGTDAVRPKTKVAQNGLKHNLVLEFLKSEEILKIGKCL